MKSLLAELNMRYFNSANGLNNIFALFFNPDGPLNPTHTAIKSLLTDSNNMLKDYLISNRTTHRK